MRAYLLFLCWALPGIVTDFVAKCKPINYFWSLSSLAHWYPQMWFLDLTARQWFCCIYVCSSVFFVHQLNCSFLCQWCDPPSKLFFFCCSSFSLSLGSFCRSSSFLWYVRVMITWMFNVICMGDAPLFHSFLKFVNSTVCFILGRNICIISPG